MPVLMTRFLHARDTDRSDGLHRKDWVKQWVFQLLDGKHPDRPFSVEAVRASMWIDPATNALVDLKVNILQPKRFATMEQVASCLTKSENAYKREGYSVGTLQIVTEELQNVKDAQWDASKNPVKPRKT